MSNLIFPLKRPTPSNALKIASFIICTAYAIVEHNTNPKNPFFSASETIIRMVVYVTGGRFIGDLFPITGDLCIIGSVSLATLATCKIFFLE